MSLQELSFRQINEALAMATMKQVPVTLTYAHGNGWASATSRMLLIRGEHLLVELPPLQAGVAPHEFLPAEKLGMAFKLKHHKQVFTATVAGLADFHLDEGGAIKVLSVCLPTRMQRLQRRMYYRADVPANRIVRASFWIGCRDTEPTAATAASPVWSGRVTNLSAGGFQLVTQDNTLPSLEIGDSVGVRLSFGSGQESVYADAQFRHLKIENGENVMGFQFVALPQSPEGRQALRVISQKVSEFQNATHHAQSQS